MNSYTVSGGILIVAGLAMVVSGVRCSATQPVTEAATCSPKADAWFATTLVTTCKGKPASECPEADALTEEYLKRESEECGP